jgi:hypothetical protein
VNQFLASRNIDGTFKQIAWRFRQGNFCHCVIGAADDVAGRMRIRAARDHVLHANSTLVDRVDLATPPSLSSRPDAGLSALAPAQRAGAQRLCALALFGRDRRAGECPLLREERKSELLGTISVFDPYRTS